MSERVFNVLFRCTGNSARSILAEAILNAVGKRRFRAFSAGSHPAGKVNPFVIELLQQQNLGTAGLRSKSWDEFAATGAPHQVSMSGWPIPRAPGMSTAFEAINRGA